MMQLSVSVTESANENQSIVWLQLNLQVKQCPARHFLHQTDRRFDVSLRHMLAASGDGKLSPELVSIVHAKHLLYMSNSTVNTETSVTGVRTKTSLDH